MDVGARSHFIHVFYYCETLSLSYSNLLGFEPFYHIGAWPWLTSAQPRGKVMQAAFEMSIVVSQY
jgi:hypothetical protein